MNFEKGIESLLVNQEGAQIKSLGTKKNYKFQNLGMNFVKSVQL